MHRVSRILQRAICAAADEEYARLTVRMTNDECAARILRAIDSLDQLRYGVPPIYDQWVALLYITWYQYGHVNLAGAILNELFHRQPVREPIPRNRPRVRRNGRSNSPSRILRHREGAKEVRAHNHRAQHRPK